MKTPPPPPRRLLAGLCGLMAFALANLLNAQTTGPQQLIFAGLLGSTNPVQHNAQFNAVQSDAAGNLYLLLDQKDGVRLIKTDARRPTFSPKRNSALPAT